MKPRHIVWLFIALVALIFKPRLEFAQVSSEIQQPAPVQSEVIGPQKMLVGLFNFSDVQSQPFTLDSVRAKILSDTKSVDSFLRENSYGKTWLEVDFVDWKTIQANSLEICPGST